MKSPPISHQPYTGTYAGKHLDRVAFPLGGIGAGMLCLEGSGAVSSVSLRHAPDVFHNPLIFSAICIKSHHKLTRLLEGPVPDWKLMFPWGQEHGGGGSGARDKTFGLPRYSDARFETRFPFASVTLEDEKMPLSIKVTGWSPFTPGDADNSSLPVAALEYQFTNTSNQPIEAIYSFHTANFMSTDAPGRCVAPTDGGFLLRQPPSDDMPWDEGAFSATVDDPCVRVNCAWFRGGWFDPITMVWRSVADGAMPQDGPITGGDPSPGGSLYVPVRLMPKQEQTLRLRLAWYVPRSNLRLGGEPETPCSPYKGCCESPPSQACYMPWYAGRFDGIESVQRYWSTHYDDLRDASEAFSSSFYDTTLPGEVVEAVAANLSILKSPTVLRQRDGRIWGWEGCSDTAGCCEGSCTHVWNYAQSLPHLFPDLERGLRETEFNITQDVQGHQQFRAAIPIRPSQHTSPAAADGQLGGVMKIHREWRISGDTGWLKRLWPKVRQSLDYCISTWDPQLQGVLIKPHHNTYDIEFWGPDSMCSSFYLGALKAAITMGSVLDDDVSCYEQLLDRGKTYVETELFDGEYFFQQIRRDGFQADTPGALAHNDQVKNYSPEALALFDREGPKYQYGKGCLSDGVLGAWLGAVCGVEPFLDADKITQHLVAVYRYNFRESLREHSNPQRSTYAMGHEAGLLLCSWPKGGEPSLPFVYSNEIWTGIEYQVASHLMMIGHVDKGLKIVRAVRDRYDGRVRNPFNEFECGHWYARAMASYALIQGLAGIRYDAIDKHLTVAPSIPGDFRSFLATATGFGVAGVEGGEPFVEVKYGSIDVKYIDYKPSPTRQAFSDEEIEAGSSPRDD